MRNVQQRLINHLKINIMKEFQIEKVENRYMISCDRFLLVNYYPVSDRVCHYAFIEQQSVINAVSPYSVGKWKCITHKTK